MVGSSSKNEGLLAQKYKRKQPWQRLQHRKVSSVSHLLRAGVAVQAIARNVCAEQQQQPETPREQFYQQQPHKQELQLELEQHQHLDRLGSGPPADGLLGTGTEAGAIGGGGIGAGSAIGAGSGDVRRSGGVVVTCTTTSDGCDTSTGEKEEEEDDDVAGQLRTDHSVLEVGDDGRDNDHSAAAAAATATIATTETPTATTATPTPTTTTTTTTMTSVVDGRHEQQLQQKLQNKKGEEHGEDHSQEEDHCKVMGTGNVFDATRCPPPPSPGDAREYPLSRNAPQVEENLEEGSRGEAGRSGGVDVGVSSYDCSRSTEDNYRTEHREFAERFSAARSLLDYSYHSNYNLARQKVQDEIIEAALWNTQRSTFRESVEGVLDYTAGGAVGDHAGKERHLGFPERPWAVFTAGAMGAGKSHVMQLLGKRGIFPMTAFVRVDLDSLRRELPEMEAYLRSDSRTAGSLTHKEAGLMAEILEEAALLEGRNILVDGSLRDGAWYAHHVEDLRRRFSLLRIAIVHVWAPENEVQARAARRAEQTGRVIPPAILHETYRAVPESVEMLAPLADYCVRIDNVGDTPDFRSRDDGDGDGVNTARGDRGDRGGVADFGSTVNGRGAVGEDDVTTVVIDGVIVGNRGSRGSVGIDDFDGTDDYIVGNRGSEFIGTGEGDETVAVDGVVGNWGSGFVGTGDFDAADYFIGSGGGRGSVGTGGFDDTVGEDDETVAVDIVVGNRCSGSVGTGDFDGADDYFVGNRGSGSVVTGDFDDARDYLVGNRDSRSSVGSGDFDGADYYVVGSRGSRGSVGNDDFDGDCNYVVGDGSSTTGAEGVDTLVSSRGSVAAAKTWGNNHAAVMGTAGLTAAGVPTAGANSDNNAAGEATRCVGRTRIQRQQASLPLLCAVGCDSTHHRCCVADVETASDWGVTTGDDDIIGTSSSETSSFNVQREGCLLNDDEKEDLGVLPILATPGETWETFRAMFS